MRRDEKLHIIVAETSPIISKGIVNCLHHISGFQLHLFEVHTYQELVDCIKNSTPDIVIVNPSFCGAFDPLQLKSITNASYKIMAIEVGVLNRPAKMLYDDVLSVIDDQPTIESKIKNLIKTDEESSLEKEPLSQREKEIIRLVVMGLTNKEIADQLYLSVYTVNTHRRNISRKLEIHSATGLTIYAIVNRLVDLSEIKM